MRFPRPQPQGLKDFAAQLGHTCSERGLGQLRVISGTRTAEAPALLNAVRALPYFVATSAPDEVRRHCAEPGSLKDGSTQLFNAGPERRFSRPGISSCAHLAYSVTLPDVTRARRAPVPSGAKDAVTDIYAKPFGLQDCSAKLRYAGTECLLGRARIAARTSSADPGASKNMVRPRGGYVALSASNTVALQHPKPFGLKNDASQILYAGPELRLAGE